MRFSEIIAATPPKMDLVLYSCSSQLRDFEEVYGPVFVNSEIRHTVPKGYTAIEWENKTGDCLDGFFDGWSNNNLYRSTDGRFWAAETIYLNGDFVPLYWIEARKKEEKLEATEGGAK